MDIYLTSLPLQLLAVLLILLFSVLSFKNPRFAALLFPIILPFYLIKLYFRPSELVQASVLNHSILQFLNSLFLPPYIETPVIRPDFEPALAFHRGSHNIILPTNLLEILIIVFLLINIPLIIRGVKRIMENSLGKYFIFSVIFFLFATAISNVYAINLRVALGAAKSWFFLPVFLFLALLPLLRYSRFRQKFLYSMALSGIFIAFLSLPFLMFNLSTYDGRLAGIFLSPNHLAMALVPGILALTLFLPSVEGRWPSSVGGIVASHHYRIALYLLLLLELLILYFTYSYGTWLALIISCLTLFVIPSAVEGSLSNFLKRDSSTRPPTAAIGRNDTDKRGLLVKIFLIPLVMFALFYSQLSNPKLQHIINGDYYSSLHSRLMIWQSALAISKDHWLTGVGADNFQQAYLDYQNKSPEPYIEWSAPQPHNIFLAFLTQLGIVGLISFIFIIIFSFLRIFVIPAKAGIQKKNVLEIGTWKFIGNWKLEIGNLDKLSLFALAYLIYLLIHGLIDTPYFKNDLAILFWFSLAAIWAAKPTRTTDYVSRYK